MGNLLSQKTTNSSDDTQEHEENERGRVSSHHEMLTPDSRTYSNTTSMALQPQTASENFIPASLLIPSASMTLPSSYATLPSASMTLPSSYATLSSAMTLPSTSATLPSASMTLPSTSTTLPSASMTLPFGSMTLPYEYMTPPPGQNPWPAITGITPRRRNNWGLASLMGAPQGGISTNEDVPVFWCQRKNCPFRTCHQHFHCNHGSCTYTSRNAPDLIKHTNEHERYDSLIENGFQRFTRFESCGYHGCIASNIYAHIHCMGTECGNKVLQQIREVTSHQRDHQVDDIYRSKQQAAALMTNPEVDAFLENIVSQDYVNTSTPQRTNPVPEEQPHQSSTLIQQTKIQSQMSDMLLVSSSSVHDMLPESNSSVRDMVPVPSSSVQVSENDISSGKQKNRSPHSSDEESSSSGLSESTTPSPRPSPIRTLLLNSPPIDYNRTVSSSSQLDDHVKCRGEDKRSKTSRLEAAVSRLATQKNTSSGSSERNKSSDTHKKRKHRPEISDTDAKRSKSHKF